MPSHDARLNLYVQTESDTPDFVNGLVGDGEHGAGRLVAKAGGAVGILGHVETDRRLDAGLDAGGEHAHREVVPEHTGHIVAGDGDAAALRAGAGAGLRHEPHAVGFDRLFEPSGGIGTKESELGFRILLWYAPGKAPVPLDRVAEIVRLTQQPPPFEATHWTLRAMARAAGIAASTVQAIWKAHGLSPHRWRNFKLSTDPAFAEKLTDIVGLYVDPPAHAVVLSIDEKSQIQALDRRSADEEGTRRHHDP